MVGNRAEMPDVGTDGEFAPKVAVGDVMRGENDAEGKDAEKNRQPAQDSDPVQWEFTDLVESWGIYSGDSGASSGNSSEPGLPPPVPLSARARDAAVFPGTCIPGPDGFGDDRVRPAVLFRVPAA